MQHIPCLAETSCIHYISLLYISRLYISLLDRIPTLDHTRLLGHIPTTDAHAVPQ